MKRKLRRTTRGKPEAEDERWAKAELRRLVEDAITDAHDESECVLGFYTMIENGLGLPFKTEILGIPVVVESVDLTERDEIVAVCRKGNHRQRIRLMDLPLPSPPPAGAEWIAAYRYWASFEGGQG